MSKTKKQMLENFKLALDNLLSDLNSMKITICILIVAVEQELEAEK